MNLFNDSYKGKRVLITGHTGFKGSWLSLWLHMLGAEVCGISLDPENENHWSSLALPIRDIRQNILDKEKLIHNVKEFSPDIVFHLAAQPLVRKSYREPVQTFETNVMGTTNILEALKVLEKKVVAVMITTDKCYENKEWEWGYRESDPLGGYDPYSASKACCEIIVSSYRNSFFRSMRLLVASARAGNVIGGGDWGEDRIIPDLVRSLQKNSPFEIRSPHATRPWQHVLDCLYGYLLLGKFLLEGDETKARAWNFGPDLASNRTVVEVLGEMKKHWPDLSWSVCKNSGPHEAGLLYLDSSRARQHLLWDPVLNFNEMANFTANWYQAFLRDKKIISREQILAYSQKLASRLS